MGQAAELKAKLIELESTKKILNSQVQDAHTQIDNLTRAKASVEKELTEKLKTIQAEYDNRLKEQEALAKEQIAALEKRYKEHMDNYTSGTKDSQSIITDLKAQIAQKENQHIQMENDLKTAQANIEQLKKTNDDLRNQISKLSDQLRQKEMSGDEMRTAIEAKLKEEFYTAKSEYVKKINDLESAKLDLELKLKDLQQNSGTNLKSAEEMRTKMAELMTKYDALIKENDELKDRVKTLSSLNVELTQFKDANINAVKNMELLGALFEKDQFFKTFNIVKAVGEISLDDLKAALGIPKVTVQKQVDQYIAVGLFENTAGGKIKLKFMQGLPGTGAPR